MSLSTSSQHTETELIKCCQTFTLRSTASSDLLGLLDLSAAFDCVDHDILLCRLRIKFSIDGSALDWIRSFLLGRTWDYNFDIVVPGRTQQVTQGACLSYCKCCLVSLKGPSWAPSCSCFTRLSYSTLLPTGILCHSHADDTEVYICIQASDHTDAIVRLATCVVRIRERMATNRLKLNDDKTRIIWLGTRQQLNKVTIDNDADFIERHCEGVRCCRRFGRSAR